MTPDLVIFDCDGVLVDTEIVTNTVIAENLTRYGLPISADETHRLFAGGTMALAGEEARRRGAQLPDDWLAEIYDEVFASLRAGVEVIDGVVSLIDRLDAQGARTAIASNGPMPKMEITLKPHGLWDRFGGNIYSGHEYGPKPAPEMIWRIMADANVRADQAVMIDDMPAGCLAAQAAGIRCYGYVADGDPARLDGTDAIKASSMDEIGVALGL